MTELVGTRNLRTMSFIEYGSQKKENINNSRVMQNYRNL